MATSRRWESVNISFNPEFLVAFMFGTIRVGAFMSISPPFQGSVPARIRAGLSMALGLACAPGLMKAATMPTTDTWGLVAGAVHQAVIGLALGFLVFVIFQAVSTAGGMIDAFAAFTSAQLFDPMSMTMTGPVGRFYQAIGTTVLFVTNGHLFLVRGLTQTFELSPLDGFRIDRFGALLAKDLLAYLTAAIQIAAPILAALFITDILLGLASRAAPKLNILMIGFSAKSLVAFMLLGAAIPLIPYVMTHLLDDSLSMMRVLVTGR